MRITNSSYLAEAIGTFFFILSILLSGGNAIIIGGALALIILLIGGISGGNVNPAVSFGMMLNGSMTCAETIGYIVSQLVGSAGAVWVYRAVA